MTEPAINIRPATADDLPAINRVIEAAVMTWELPERVKRLSLPSYRYNEHDLQHLDMVVAETREAGITGVASWEPAADKDCPPGNTGLLLHGLYVDPTAQGVGMGTALLDEAARAARAAGVDGLLVKAQADAVAFFSRRGMQALPVEDPTRHYANRLWKAVSPGEENN
jgi:predicted N-acetyltransferase YhbS